MPRQTDSPKKHERPFLLGIFAVTQLLFFNLWNPDLQRLADCLFSPSIVARNGEIL